MSSAFDKKRTLVENGEIKISVHGYDELSLDGILVKDVLTGLLMAL